MAMAATCNQELNRLFHVAASATNQQQTLAYRLLSQDAPDSAMLAAARDLDASSSPCRRRSKSLASIARTKMSTTAAILSASPGVIAHWPAPRSPPSSPRRCRGRSRSAAARISPCARGVATIRVRDRAASRSGQRLGLAREQRGGEHRLVARAGPASGRIARPALLVRPPARPPRQFW